jgi:NADPH:quinone reductase-like Zn-dependent oxidoreductase
VQLDFNLPWEELAALPESYATAWTCLFRNLELAKGQTLLLRGATSSFGFAALNLAVEAGANVIAATRNRDRFKKLEDLGAHRVEMEGPELSARIAEAKQIDEFSTWLATAQFSIRFGYSVEADEPVLPDGSAVWLPSLISTRCCRWPAASI